MLGGKTRRVAAEAMALRAWVRSCLLTDDAPVTPPDVSSSAWNIVLQQERCAILLNNFIRRSPIPISLPPHATKLLSHYSSGEVSRVLSVRAQLATLAGIASEKNWRIIVLKGSSDIAEGLDVPVSDVDVWCDEDTASALCVTLDKSGFTAGNQTPGLHASPRSVPGMVSIEVHRGVVGFTRPADMPVDRAVELAHFPPLERLAPEDHAWTVLVQAVFKHPDRLSRMRDLLMLRKATDACDAEALARLEQRIRSDTERAALDRMVQIARGAAEDEFATYRHYVLLLRHPKGWTEPFAAMCWMRISGTGMTGVAGEYRRLRRLWKEDALTRGTWAWIRSFGFFAALSAAAIIKGADVLLINAVRSIGAVIATPYYIANGRWRSLLELPASHATAYSPSSISTTDRALHALARIPLLPWRTTCLYRCVAVCIAMRWSHMPAILRVGVAGAVATEAHAWIEDQHGNVLYEKREGFTPLA